MKPRRRRIIPGIVVAALTLLSLPVWLRPAPEPLYRGLTLAEWVQLNETYIQDLAFYQPAMVALGGSKAIPFYMRELTVRDNPLAERSWAWLEARGSIQRPRRTAEKRRASAASFFQILGPGGAPATGEIQRLLRHPHFEPDARRLLVGVLGAIGPEAAAAVPDLVHELDTSLSPLVRANSAWALGHIAAEPAVAVPSLCRALVGNDALTLAAAAGALGAYGTNSRPALPRLRELAEAANPHSLPAWTGLGSVRDAARQALNVIEPSPRVRP